MAEGDKASPVILVVDDYDDSRRLVCVWLGLMGYKVIEACNGLEAVKIALRACPDLIIMDLSMPVLDGFGAVRLLREVLNNDAVPIVACTAHDTSTHRELALSTGFNEYITKPIDLTHLSIVVDRFLKAA